MTEAEWFEATARSIHQIAWAVMAVSAAIVLFFLRSRR